MRSLLSLTVATLALAPATAFAQAQLPAGVAAPGETVILTVHAEGAQVYDCKAGADGKLVWTFREPIATLPVLELRLAQAGLAIAQETHS